MAHARELLTRHIVVAKADQRLNDVAERVTAVRADCCVVLHEDTGMFMGIVRLADVAKRAHFENRILADLISSVPPLQVSPDESADHVAGLMERHAITDAVVLSDGRFIGMISSESMLRWMLGRYTELKRTSDSEHATVVALQNEAASLRHSKKQFLSGISHDLRTPLNPVLLIASERAEDLTIDPGLRADFSTIADHIRTEAKMVTDLLDVASLSHRDGNRDQAGICLHTMLDAVVAKSAHAFSAKSVQLQKNFYHQRPTVGGDDVLLHRALESTLRVVAGLALPSDTIRIETKVTFSARTLQIILSDSRGCLRELSGESPDESVHVPLKATPPISAYRTELGLATRIFEAHKGRIQVTHPIKQSGSSLAISLPLDGFIHDPSVLPRMAAPSRGASGTILIVEDHAASRSILRSILERKNLRILAAGSAEEALTLCEANRVSLVISDLGLPGKSGLDLMRELKDRFDVPGISLSGLGSPDDVEQARLAGFDFHITKPVDVSKILGTLSNYPFFSKGEDGAAALPAVAAH